MPQSFKHAWRWLVGASAAAILIASISPAANAQAPDTGIISICIWMNNEIDRVCCGLTNYLTPMIEINQLIRDGLK